MEPNYQEVANRIRALREDMGLTMQEMADATGRSLAEYQAPGIGGGGPVVHLPVQMRRANLGVDPIELLTGETPHLTGYTLTRADDGPGRQAPQRPSSTCTRPRITATSCAEPFYVTADYRPELQDKPIHLSYHAGQELDYILEGRMRFQYEEHTEELGPGDMLLYDSGRGHGMIAIDGAPCKFLAVVLKAKEDII